MKLLLPLAVLVALAGCASRQPGPANYGTRAPGMAVGSVTEDGWRVVSVTPVGQEPQNVYQNAPIVVEPYYTTPPVTFSLGVMLGRGAWFGSHHHYRGRHHGRRH